MSTQEKDRKSQISQRAKFQEEVQEGENQFREKKKKLRETVMPFIEQAIDSLNKGLHVVNSIAWFLLVFLLFLLMTYDWLFKQHREKIVVIQENIALQQEVILSLQEEVSALKEVVSSQEE